MECRDGGQPLPLVASRNVTPLHATSRNVTARVAAAGRDVPRFSRCVYDDVSVAENNRPGARVLRVSAADRDTARNASVTYSLADDANGTQLESDSYWTSRGQTQTRPLL